MIGRKLKWEDEPVCISNGETVKDVSTKLIVYAQQKAVGYFNKTLPNFKLNCLKQQFIDDRVNIINAYMQGVIDAFNNKKNKQIMINIANILKDVPKGTKLYSPIFGECTLNYVGTTAIKVNTDITFDSLTFDEYGKIFPNGECLLFPSKEVKEWDNFSIKKYIL